MLPAIEWFRTIAASLNDDEPGMPFQRYAIKDLVAAYNRGLAFVFAYRKDLFTDYKKIRLTPGFHQKAPACCDSILEIVAQVDENGGIIKPLKSTKDKARKGIVKGVWNKPSCLNRIDEKGKTFDFILDGATLTDGLNGHFDVEPAVPKDIPVWVQVKCAKKPCELREENLNGALPTNEVHNAALWSYVLYAALIGDRYAANAIPEAMGHLRVFENFLGMELKQEQLFKKGGLND